MVNQQTIACIVQIYNELEKGNLKRFFHSIKPLVDYIVIYDDCSTDGSYEYAQTKTQYVIRGKKNDFDNEMSHRQQVLEKALTLKPDFILWLDADEILSKNAKNELNGICSQMASDNIDGVSFEEINLWRSNKWYRTDSLFGDRWFTRLWKVTSNMKFPITRGLHQLALPTSIINIRKNHSIKVIHYGFATDLNISSKYITYKNRGQRGYVMLDRLINVDNLKIKKISSKLLPLKDINKANKKPIPRDMNNSLQIVEKYRAQVERPKYSIICLIYKDVKWLRFVYEQVIKYTDLSNKEFYFVANNANDEVINYLKNNYIPHYIFNHQSNHNEWYINNVYRAWNFGAHKAKGDFLVFINSDMAFSPNWLENLINKYDGNNCIVARLVESGKMKSGMYGVTKNFGYEHDTYEESQFQVFAKNISKKRVISSGLFMPLLIRKSHFTKVGGYPEGNVVPESDYFAPKIAARGEECISGDVALIEKLKSIKIKHQTSLDSIVYHFQEGEMDSNFPNTTSNSTATVAIVNDHLTGIMGEKVLWNNLLENLPATTGIDKTVTGLGNNFEKKASEYLHNKLKDIKLIIQNGSFISKISENHRTIIFIQDNLRAMGRRDNIQEKNLYFADRIVTNSLQVIQDYPEYDIDYIPVGVDSQLFRPLNRQKMRLKHNLPSNKIGIFVGSFNEVKGFNELKKLIKKFPYIYWVLVLKTKDTFKADNVRIFNQINHSKLSELLSAADFFFIGSKVETQCLAAIEAALCDTPIVMRNVGFVQSLSNSDKQKIGEIGNNFEKSVSLVINKNSYKPREVIVKNGFDIPSMVRKWENLIQEEMFKVTSHELSHLGNKRKSKIKKIQESIKYQYKRRMIETFGRENIDLGDLGKLIIKYSPRALYKFYRRIRYK